MSFNSGPSQCVALFSLIQHSCAAFQSFSQQVTRLHGTKSGNLALTERLQGATQQKGRATLLLCTETCFDKLSFFYWLRSLLKIFLVEYLTAGCPYDHVRMFKFQY